MDRKYAPTFSRREAEITALATTGLSCAEIGERLFVSVNTVKTHLQHVYDKAGVRNRVQLERYIVHRGPRVTAPVTPARRHLL
jgi:DNA-binding CsgD family transcriptional regulator